MTEGEIHAFYAQWLKKPLWSCHEALRLLVCPPCPDVEFCWRARKNPPPKDMNRPGCGIVITEFGAKGDENRRKRELLSRPCQEGYEYRNVVVLAEHDVSRGLFPWDKWGMVEPMALIEWALSKPNVTIQQPLIDWYYQHKVAMAADLSPPAAPTSPPNETVGIPFEKEPRKIPINVPPSLWAGKNPATIYASLAEKGFANAIIAYVLMKKADATSKTNAGRLFYQEDKGEHEPKPIKKTDKLLKEAEKYSITFE